MKLSKDTILGTARWRDEVIFLGYTLLVTALYQLSNYSFMKWELTRISLTIIMISQFYLTSFVKFPVRKYLLRKVLYLFFHVLNFIVFREVIVALTPSYIVADRYFEAQLIIYFLLILLGRDIKLYSDLRKQLTQLDRWTRQKVLFEKPEKIEVNLGEPGLQRLHPNEIVYIRTKFSGDHTKIFGIKSRENDRFKEYETTTYANFDEIGKLLRQFPQFKRISQSVVINFKYPYEEKNGVIKLEGRRFAISKRYAG